jgi:hypothetical protein
VTCLAVDGNNAVIGFVDERAGPLGTLVNDSGGPGSDGFAAFPGPTDCLTAPGISLSPIFGDFAVYDAPSKDQCKHGGWRNYTDAGGQPFSDQGDCIAFALGAF